MGRRLGQHFLAHQPTLQRIAAAACAAQPPTVVEIGPGRGALTVHLLAHASRVVAIEIDPVLAQYLRARFRGDPRLEVVEQDVLKANLAAWGPVTVAGNLPYYITSPIVEKTLALGPLLQSAVFLVQLEVAHRLAAEPGSRDYGYLSVQAQLASEVTVLFPVPRSAFRPPPKVDSAVVRLLPCAPKVDDQESFLAFARLCFRQKRKTLRNNLLAAYSKERIGALPETSQRAEQLSIPQLAVLWRRLSSSESSPSVRRGNPQTPPPVPPANS